MENINNQAVMTVEKILEVISDYKNEFNQKEISPIRYDEEGFTTLPKKPDPIENAQNCYWMIIQMEEQIKSGEFEIGKLNRWLGFIQGCLFSIAAHSISQMRDHNRP